MILNGLRAWIRAFVHPDMTNREIDEELQYHIEREIERRIAGGASAADARAAARRAFGNTSVHHEHVRDAAGGRTLEHLVQDLRYAARTLRRTPAYTTTAVISLALGIGVSTAIFSVADVLLFRPLAIDAPDRVVTIEQQMPNGLRYANLAYSDFERFRERTTIFAGMTATTWADGFNVITSGPRGGIGDRQERISIVTGNFFSMLGVRPALGRFFTDDEDGAPGAHPVAVISDAYWAARFHRDRSVVGRTLTVNGTTFDIIGVAPRAFGGDWIGWPTDFWVPVAMQAEVAAGTRRGVRGGFAQFKLLARLAPGVTAQQASAALAPLHAEIARENVRGSGVVADARVTIRSASRGYSGQRDSFVKPIAVLLGLVTAVLFIVCANIANLSLARATARQREMALRLAIGASRMRVMRQLLTESALVAAMGGALGVLIALAGMDILASLIASGPATGVYLGMQSVVLDLRLDSRILLFALGASGCTVCAFGLLPAIRGSRVPLFSVLGARGAFTGQRGIRTRKALVVAQVALSLILLVDASVFVRSVRNLRHENIGVADRSRLVLASTLPGQTTLRGDALRAVIARVHDRLAAATGVVSLSESGSGLLTGSSGGPRVWAEASASNSPNGLQVDGSMTVGPGFFATVGQPLVAGRDFVTHDTDTAGRSVIVNESLARHLFAADNAVGRRISTAPGDLDASYEIVGVVRDARYRNPREPAGFMTYWPLLNSGRASRVTFVARIDGNATALMSEIRRSIYSTAPALPVLDVVTVDEQLEELLFQDRLIADFAAFFGLLALCIANIGLFGVVSYVAAQRTSEIAIRMALGARRSRVLTMVLGESARLVAIGVLVGAPLAFLLRQAAASLTYGLPGTDVLSIAAAAALMLAIAVPAALVPARRAAMVDPAVTLKGE